MVTREHLKWYKLGNYALIPFPPADTPLSELPPLRILPFKMEPKEGLPLLEEEGLEGLEELEDPGLRQPPLFHPLPPLFHPLPPLFQPLPPLFHPLPPLFHPPLLEPPPVMTCMSPLPRF